MKLCGLTEALRLGELPVWKLLAKLGLDWVAWAEECPLPLTLCVEESVSLGIHVAQYLDLLILWHPDWSRCLLRCQTWTGACSKHYAWMFVSVWRQSYGVVIVNCWTSLGLHFSLSKIG